MPNRRLLPYLSNAATLAVLATAAYWGHRHHWRIPSLSEVIGRAPLHAKQPANGAKAPAGDSGELAVVQFDTPEAVMQAGIESVPAVERSLDVFVKADAVVGYDQTRVAQLSSRAPGFVWSMHTHLGQFVRKGELLTIIDSQEVGQAKADLLQETAASAFKDRQLERVRGSGQGVVAERQIRELEAAALEARVRKFNAQQRLINLGFDFDFQELRDVDPEKLDRRIQFLGMPEAVLQRMDPRPKTANLIPLLAPFDGVITQLEIVVGERVAPDHPPIVMADVRTMWVRLSLRKEDAERLALGQKVLFTTDGVPHGVEGKLIWISTAMDEKTHTVQARALVNNPLLQLSTQEDGAGPRLLRVNEFGSARVLVDQVAQAVLVPEKALQRLMDQSPLVFVARPDGKSFEPRKVKLGQAQDKWVHLLSGVRAGERVATTNSYVLKSELMKETLVSDN